MGGGSASPKRILIVEDEPTIGEFFRRVLTKEGFEVDIAGDGETAQGKVAENEYALLFFDIRLPGIHGDELYAWLVQKYPQFSDRVAFTTGGFSESETLAFLEGSGKPYLFKPFGRDELRTFIGKVLAN